MRRDDDGCRRRPTLSLCKFKLLIQKRAEAVSRLATANPNFSNEETLKPEDKGVGGAAGEIDKLGTSTRRDWLPIDSHPSNFLPDDKDHTAEDHPLQESNVGGASASTEEDVRDSNLGGGAGKIEGHLEVRRQSLRSKEKKLTRACSRLQGKGGKHCCLNVRRKAHRRRQYDSSIGLSGIFSMPNTLSSLDTKDDYSHPGCSSTPAPQLDEGR